MAKCIAMGLCCCLMLLGLPRRASAEEPVDYVRDVKTLLKSRCYACHGALKQEAGLRLDSVALMLKGGDNGPAIEQAQPEASLLVKRIAAQNEAERMPAEGRPLSSEEIAKISAWIAAGARAPGDDRPEPDPRDHWAFRRPTRPAAPVAANAGWVRNPIDAFLALEHERHGLTPNPSADRATLLRRVYLDLVGLPPNRDELHAFLADTSPEAYEKVVERLLASPQYGERWGRHWMDVWRYSDWYGRRTVPDVMNSYPMIWRWRDWIVRSLNEDKGYDRMVLEMLAADEVAPEDDQTIVATGYLVRNFFKWNYNQWMKDNVEHTAKAFLGLTLNCAHCHDHKYDPISQAEYFQFRAFFEPLELRQDRVPGAPDPGPFQKYIYGKPYGPIPGGMIRVFDEKLDAQTFMYSGGDERNKIEGRPPVAPGVPAMLGLQAAPIEPVSLPAVAAYPGLKPFIQAEEVAKRQAPIAAAEQQLAAARNEVAGKEPTLIAALKTAEDKLAAAKANCGESRSQALVGKQSLFLDARQGRRALANPVSAVAAVRNGSAVSFQIKLWADAHANFQLGLDISTGATGAYVGFEQGRILTYRPGTFEVMEIGRYDLAGGQNHFQVVGIIDVAQDTIAFTIKSLPDGAALASAVPAALHGWNPQGRPQQGIFVDARPGTAVAFDEITFTHPGESPAVHFDFEEPACMADEDVVGRQGWLATTYCLAPATSVVGAAELADPATLAAKAEVTLAQQRVDALRASVTSAEANLAAAKAELAAVQARIAAGNARYLAAADADALAKQAWQAERAAAHAQAAANEQAATLAWLTVATKPGAEAEIAAAKTKLAEAQKATAAAAQAAAGSSQEFTLISPVYPQRSTGRRTALAKAIIDRNNPLTARVAVNHLWMRHFGQPLVETLFDFGRNGKPPSHPELLDWLAVELMDGGWKMKSIHRLIVTSNAYRMASAGASPNLQTDRQNRWLWRFPRRQIESEVVRDAVLHSAGQLDLVLGGQEIEHAQAATTRRRSLYISHHGEAREPLLEMFDAANPAECYRRTQTVVPQQALALVNAELTLQPSRILARHLWRQVQAETAEANLRDAAFVDAAFEQLLTRSPNPAERQAALELLQRQLEVYRQSPAGAAASDAADPSHPAADPALRAKESLIHVLYSHHDFITVR